MRDGKEKLVGVKMSFFTPGIVVQYLIGYSIAFLRVTLVTTITQFYVHFSRYSLVTVLLKLVQVIY